MFIAEIFTSPYAAAVWKWSEKNPMLWIGHFTIEDRTYQVEIDGVPYSKVSKQFDLPPPKVMKELMKGDDIIYNVRFGIEKNVGGQKIVSTTPVGKRHDPASIAGDAIVVLTTVGHMIREFTVHVNPKTLCFWPALPKLKNIYKKVIERVFPSWTMMPAKYSVFDGFLIHS